MSNIRLMGAFGATAASGFGLAVMMGLQEHHVPAPVGSARQPAHEEFWHKTAVIAPRDPTSFRIFFEGRGAEYQGFRTVAVLPNGADQVYVVLESPPK